MLVPIGDALVVASTPEEVQYGDIALDENGVLWEHVEDRDYDAEHNRNPFPFEWRRIAGEGRYSSFRFSAVRFPVRIILRQQR